MRYQIAPLFCRPWTLLGITPRLIESHYENNYGGAFTRLNAISEELEALDPATTPAHVIRRLKQDEAAALNSLALHELYFASLGGDGRTIPEVMANALVRVSELAWSLRERLAELDVNPLIVRPRGLGVVAADVLVVLR